MLVEVNSINENKIDLNANYLVAVSSIVSSKGDEIIITVVIAVH